MTTTPMTARTANEQKIEALEAELVTVRQALDWTLKWGNFYVAIDNPLHAGQLDKAHAALSATDYEGKVVVDREVIHEITAKLEEIRVKCYNDTISAADQHVHALATNCLARLDSLRRGGGE